MNYYVINKSTATVHLFGGKMSLAPSGSGGDSKRLLGFSRDHDNIKRLKAKGLVEVVDEVEYRKRAGKNPAPAPAPKPAPPAPEPPAEVTPDPDEVDTVELDEDEEPADDDAPEVMSLTEFKGLTKKKQIAKLDELGVEDYDDSTKKTLEQAYEDHLNA